MSGSSGAAKTSLEACWRVARIRLGAILLVAATATTLCPTPAAAWDKWRPTHYQSFAEVDLGIWSASGVGTTLPLISSGQYVFDDLPLAIGGRLPLVANIYGPSLSGNGNASRVSMGNVELSATYLGRDGRTWWWLGGGLGLPLTAFVDDDSLLANALAVLSASGSNLDLWGARAFPLHVAAGFDWRPKKWVSLRFTTRPVILVPIASREDVEFSWENRPGVEFRHPDAGLGGGFDLPITWWATAPIPLDRSHWAFFPYISYSGDSDGDSHLFAQLGFWMALNEPFGFAFDRGKVATLRMSVGASL